ncbi:hypothetical protein Tco_0764201 [Tanacetum coccineum]
MEYPTEDPYEEAAQQALEQAPPTLEYVSNLMELVDHPLPTDASPVSLSPGYIADSNLKEDEEDHEKDPANEGDDDDDESSDDDDDDDDVEEDEEEEDHLASADSTGVASPAVDHVPSAEETELFETAESATTPPQPPAYRTTPRMNVRTQTPISFPSEEEVARLLALPTPPPSPLTLLSSPPTSPTYAQAHLGCRVAIMRATPSHIPLPTSFLPSPIRPLHTREAMALMRAAAPSTYHSLLPAGTPPLYSPITCTIH